MSKPKPALSTATIIATPIVAVNSVCWGLSVGVGVGVGETVGEGVMVGVVVGDGDVEGVCVGVGIDAFGSGIAWGLASVRKGTKFTVPKVKSFLLSKIDWLIIVSLVVSHQL